MTCASRGRSAALEVSIVAAVAGPVATWATERRLNENAEAATTAARPTRRRQSIPIMEDSRIDGVRRLVDYTGDGRRATATKGTRNREPGTGNREPGTGNRGPLSGRSRSLPSSLALLWAGACRLG